MLWGLFKKVVIADGCAKYATLIFAQSADLSGSTLVLGALFFTFQIYGDFSGYSDMAIGTARLFGFDLKRILPSRISPGIWPSFGGVGTFPYPPGSGITFTSPWGAVEAVPGKKSEMPYSCFV
jgi:hypothetical protein